MQVHTKEMLVESAQTSQSMNNENKININSNTSYSML